MFGVNAFAEEFGDEDAAAFVVAAEIPVWEHALTAAELGADPETTWLPEGCWSIDRGDERVKDFPVTIYERVRFHPPSGHIVTDSADSPAHPVRYCISGY